MPSQDEKRTLVTGKTSFGINYSAEHFSGDLQLGHVRLDTHLPQSQFISGSQSANTVKDIFLVSCIS